jgi:hypothetical protein
MEPDLLNLLALVSSSSKQFTQPESNCCCIFCVQGGRLRSPYLVALASSLPTHMYWWVCLLFMLSHTRSLVSRHTIYPWNEYMCCILHKEHIQKLPNIGRRTCTDNMLKLHTRTNIHLHVHILYLNMYIQHA